MSRTVRQSQYSNVAQKAINADSASRANLANTATSASYATTASLLLGSVQSASYAATASILLGGVQSASFATSASYAATSSYSTTLGANLGNTDTGELKLINSAGSTISGITALTASLALQANTASYVLNAVSSSRATTASFAITSSYILNAVSASRALTASLAITASYILNAVSSSFASTSSFITILNQNVIITGSVAIGTGSIGNGENNLLLGPAPAGGIGEGGQIAFLAVGGTYTSSSFIDNYQNQFRILSGPGAVSNAGVFALDLGTRNAKFEGAVTASAFNGLPNDYLYVTRNIDQTIVSGTWANRDIIFNNVVTSKGITYNTGTGLASLTGGKVYRITARLAWIAGAVYLLQFSCYNSSNTILGPTVEIVQAPNTTNNISDATLDFIYAPGSNIDIKIRTTGGTNALTGEYIRGDLNTQLIIQQIA